MRKSPNQKKKNSWVDEDLDQEELVTKFLQGK